jgi:hypothetical protein
MKRFASILYLCLFETLLFTASSQDSLRFRGQASAWALYNDRNTLPFYAGGRYIPQLNFNSGIKNGGKIDFEASVNINGSAGFNFSDSFDFSGRIKPYRLWARYSTEQLEIRLGLQKINFGSASLLRPLMWFDQVDPRDPLKLTDGVWGILGRYYFLNNANIWLWGLYGNNNPRGWEYSGTNSRYPEAGGRVQIPVPRGEAGISYNYRVANTKSSLFPVPAYDNINENKLGFDIKLDLKIGLWLEGSWTRKSRNLGIYTNQELLNAGLDYTFKPGNGLYMIFEQLVVSYDEDPFRFKNKTFMSLISFSYPISLFDNISTIVYYDWKNRNTYNFLSWQKQFSNNLSMYLMGYWNPLYYRIPAQGEGQNLYAGRGIQVMMVFNH